MDRIKELELKKQKGTISDEESDELFELKEEEFEESMNEAERVGMYQSVWGWM